MEKCVLVSCRGQGSPESASSALVCMANIPTLDHLYLLSVLLQVAPFPGDIHSRAAGAILRETVASVVIGSIGYSRAVASRAHFQYFVDYIRLWAFCHACLMTFMQQKRKFLPRSLSKVRGFWFKESYKG